MESIGYLRGHEIICIDEECFYADTKEPTASTYKERPCKKCGKFPTKEDHDACLKTLPNLMNACCGHGRDEEAYVQYWDGKVISGQEAIEIIKKLKE